MRPRQTPPIGKANRVRRGVVIIAVLVVITVLSLAAYQYSDLMMAEYRAADNAHRNAQARALADSGVHYAAALVASPDNVTGLLNGNPWSNPDKFRDVAVPGDDQLSLPGRFTLIAPLDPDDAGGSDGCRYGLIDEGGKLNPNALMKVDPSGQLLHDMLMKLPNMTEDVADSIVDWIDADTDPRPSGAESDYYSGLSPSYRCKNGPLDSVDELLLIKGVTKELLFGADTNRNGMQDGDEAASDGAFDRGWSAFLTVYSREQNRDATGQAYVYVNGPIQDVYDRLSPEVGDDLAKFIIIYRQYGASTSNSGRGVMAGILSSYTPDTSKKGSTKINSLFDLINVQVAIPGQTQGAPTVVYPSPLNDPATQKDLMPKLFAKASLVEETEISGRVNVNTAPREVLMALPSLNEGDVQNILSLRPKASSTDAPSEVYQTPTWLLTEANIPLATLRQLDKYVTTRTQVYRVQSVGYFDGKGPAARVEAVIDANGGRPRILAWRDLSELGRGWNPK